MHKRKRGQTLVEFAMVLPLLLAIIMGIIDFSYIVFGWAQTQFAARRGAEQASKLPPAQVRAPAGYDAGYINSDECYQRILEEVKIIGSFSAETTIQDNEVQVSWWSDNDNGATDPNSRFSMTTNQADRQLLTVIEVYIDRGMRPLTPLGDALFGTDVRMSSVSRRSITSLDSPLQPCQ